MSFDLTADTPSPASARGIVDDDNDRRGGDGPPDLPRLHETSPKADKKPRALRSALPSHAAAATLSFDLTADTPSPVSARGIADDDNDHRGGDARNDSARPPDLPHLHETSVYVRSNTSHALASVSAPVTNSSSSPQRKKSRSLPCRYSGKVNSSNDISFELENRKTPFLLPKLTPGGSETLSPVVVDVLAGK